MGPTNPQPPGGELRPAFDNDWQALGVVLLVATALAAPVLLARFHPQNREHVYQAMRGQDGGFPFVRHEIFDVKDDVDILFTGPSTVWTGISSPLVQQALTERLGRPARVVTFGSAGASIDVQYMQVRDALQHKRVGMVVTSIPRAEFKDSPSPAGFRFLSYDNPPETAGLPLRYRAMLYAGYVLRSPHDFLDWLRPNRPVPFPWAYTNGGILATEGWYGGPAVYVPFAPPSPQAPPDDLIYAARSRSSFAFSGMALPPYHTYYLHKLNELLAAHQVKLVFVNIPEYAERRRDTAIERLCWPEVLGKPAVLVGIRPAVLFANLADADIQKLYYNNLHFNRNGNEMFTRTITPALLELYENRARLD